MNLIVALSVLATGCATLYTRFSSAPSEVEDFFPSTRRAAQMLDDLEFDKDADDLFVALFVAVPVFIYSLVEYVPAVTTDVLLLPMDGYFVWRKSAKERQEREDFRKQIEEMSPSQKEELNKHFPELTYAAWDDGGEYLLIYNAGPEDWPWCLVFAHDVFGNEYLLEWCELVHSGHHLKICKPDFVDRRSGMKFNPDHDRIKEIWVEVPQYKGGKITVPRAP